jgi:hypothetical protein
LLPWLNILPPILIGFLRRLVSDHGAAASANSRRPPCASWSGQSQSQATTPASLSNAKFCEVSV